MIDSVKSGRQIQQNKDGSSFWLNEEPDKSLLSGSNNEWLKTTRSSVLAMNGRREIGL